jgi:hypothetical protein
MYRKRTYVWMRVLTRDMNCQSAYTLNSPFDSLTLERLTQRERVSIGGGRGERRSTSDRQNGYVTGAEFRSCFNSGHSSDHPDHTEATHHELATTSMQLLVPQLPPGFSGNPAPHGGEDSGGCREAKIPWFDFPKEHCLSR